MVRRRRGKATFQVQNHAKKESANRFRLPSSSPVVVQNAGRKQVQDGHQEQGTDRRSQNEATPLSTYLGTCPLAVIGPYTSFARKGSGEQKLDGNIDSQDFPPAQSAAEHPWFHTTCSVCSIPSFHRSRASFDSDPSRWVRKPEQHHKRWTRAEQKQRKHRRAKPLKFQLAILSCRRKKRVAASWRFLLGGGVRGKQQTKQRK